MAQVATLIPNEDLHAHPSHHHSHHHHTELNNSTSGLNLEEREIEEEIKQVDDKHLSSNMSALINIIKANIGSGILGMPYAFKCSGYWLGLFSIVIIMFVVVHCTILLVDSKHYLNDQRKKKRRNASSGGDTDMVSEIITFNDIGYAAFGRTATVVITFFLFVTQLGFCCAVSLYRFCMITILI